MRRLAARQIAASGIVAVRLNISLTRLTLRQIPGSIVTPKASDVKRIPSRALASGFSPTHIDRSYRGTHFVALRPSSNDSINISHPDTWPAGRRIDQILTGGSLQTDRSER